MRIDELYKAKKLRTSSRTRPGLFITEFGYFNRPPAPSSELNSVHTEVERATWYAQALGVAKRNNARSFAMWETAEDPAKDANLEPTWEFKDQVRKGAKPRTSFDTGVMGSHYAKPPAFPYEFGLVTGMRYYGKGPPSNPGKNTRQTRLAYCRIWQWARDAGLPVSKNECPQAVIP